MSSVLVFVAFLKINIVTCAQVDDGRIDLERKAERENYTQKDNWQIANHGQKQNTHDAQHEIIKLKCIENHACKKLNR